MDPYGPSSFVEEVSFVIVPAFVSAMFMFFAIFFAILLAGRRLMFRVKPGSKGPSAALSIVQERYARGELSRQEFEQMRSVLEG